MLKLVQSRVGNDGTCFRTCLASLLNLQESQIPDFPDANEDPYVNTFLAKHGLKYKELPYVEGEYPAGLYLLLGVSPRGGMHVVIEKDGKLVWDTHPKDSTGRGISEPLKYGVLLPTGAKDSLRIDKNGSMSYDSKLTRGFKAWAQGRNGAKDSAIDPFRKVYKNKKTETGKAVTNYHLGKLCTGRGLVEPLKYGVLTRVGKAKDGAPLSGKRLNSAAEKLYEKHDDIDDNLERQEWMRQGGPAIAAYNATHGSIVSLVREAEALLSKAKLDDDPVYWQRKITKAKDAIKKSKQYAKARDYKLALSYQEGAFTLAHSVIDKMRKSGSARGRDALPASRILKYDIADMLDRVGVTPTEFLRRDSEQRRRLLETAFQELSKEKGGSAVVRAKDKRTFGEAMCPQCKQDVPVTYADGALYFAGHSKKGTPFKCPGSHHLAGKAGTSDSSGSSDRRSRLHRALDAVMDSALPNPVQCPTCRKLVSTNSAGKMAFHDKTGRSVSDPTGPHCSGSGKSAK